MRPCVLACVLSLQTPHGIDQWLDRYSALRTVAGLCSIFPLVDSLQQPGAAHTSVSVSVSAGGGDAPGGGGGGGAVSYGVYLGAALRSQLEPLCVTEGGKYQYHVVLE